MGMCLSGIGPSGVGTGKVACRTDRGRIVHRERVRVHECTICVCAPLRVRGVRARVRLESARPSRPGERLRLPPERRQLHSARQAAALVDVADNRRRWLARSACALAHGRPHPRQRLQRPVLSFESPTLPVRWLRRLARRAQVRAVVGGSGGSKIITATVQTLVGHATSSAFLSN